MLYLWCGCLVEFLDEGFLVRLYFVWIRVFENLNKFKRKEMLNICFGYRGVKKVIK